MLPDGMDRLRRRDISRYNSDGRGVGLARNPPASTSLQALYLLHVRACERACRRLCEYEGVCVSVCVSFTLMHRYAIDFCVNIYAFHAFV